MTSFKRPIETMLVEPEFSYINNVKIDEPHKSLIEQKVRTILQKYVKV